MHPAAQDHRGHGVPGLVVRGFQTFKVGVGEAARRGDAVQVFAGQAVGLAAHLRVCSWCSVWAGSSP